MFLRASKDLDEPAHMWSVIDGSAFLTIFTLYVILVWGVFYCIHLCFLVLNQTDMREIKEKKYLFNCFNNFLNQLLINFSR